MKKTPRQFHGTPDQRPVDQPIYKLKALKGSERLTIRLVYWRTWRKLVNKSRLSTPQREFAKIYFQEIHVRYYKTVVIGGSYVTVSRLIRNYFLSKANENLRATIFALSPYNLTSFVNGMRSQIELNALLHKFIKDPEYHKKHITLNEDRKRVNELPTVINVNTLVSALDSSVIPYKDVYDSLSLLLHPNPTAIKFYAQAEGSPTPDKSGVFRPKIKFYFDQTIEHCKSSSEWFCAQTWLFLSFIEHFLILFDDLVADFHVSKIEEKQHNEFAMRDFVLHHEREILRAVNKAERDGTDIAEAANREISRLLSESTESAGSAPSSKSA